jgi:hypothetical protein
VHTFTTAMRQQTALPSLMLGFGVASLVSSTLMLASPSKAWRMYGASVPARSIPHIVYASAVFGEGVLQLCAWKQPARFMDGCVAFMLPYKCLSVASLWWWRKELPNGEAEAVALQWLVPAVMIGVALMSAHE